jgi:hypothetical protein
MEFKNLEKGFFIHRTRSNDYPWGCGNGFFAWLDSYDNRLRKKNPIPSDLNVWSPHCEVCGDHNDVQPTDHQIISGFSMIFCHSFVSDETVFHKTSTNLGM